MFGLKRFLQEKISAQFQDQTRILRTEISELTTKLEVLYGQTRKTLQTIQEQQTEQANQINHLSAESEVLHGQMSKTLQAIQEQQIEQANQINHLSADSEVLYGQTRKTLQAIQEQQMEQVNQINRLAADLAKVSRDQIDKSPLLPLLSENSSSIRELHPIDDSIPSKILQLSRLSILNRWFCIDSMDLLRYPPNKKISCTICGYEAEKNAFDTKISECVFNGGKLERFVCPQCGTIFGPLKMLELTPQQLSDDYRTHYMNYAEGDSTESELLCFSEIDRGQDKVYLNFGSGAWSQSSNILRERGYTIFDYEPYAHSPNHQWLITNFEDLKSRKFDGIFSNDLIEHLRNPIADLKNMTALLRDTDCRMAHSSGCFDYAYEHTRFHLHFLPLTALQIIAKHCGLNVDLICRESPTNTNFKIAVFSGNQNGVQS